MSNESSMDGIRYLRTIHPTHSVEKLTIFQKWVARRGRKKIGRIKYKTSIGLTEVSNLLHAKQTIKFVIRKLLSPPLKIIGPGLSWVEERIQFKHFTSRIIEVAKAENAEIIHAHVPYRVGMPAMKAARKLGLPFVYEMRGMWEESAVAGGRWRAGGLAHRRFRRMETKVLRNADAVICISETLRKEAMSRGVPSERITIVPNAVNTEESVAEPSELVSEMKNKLGNSSVVGYIGSLRELEGVDLTADAVAMLRNQGVDAKLFVLSSESGQSELIAHCERLGIGEHAYVVGPVPHEQVAPFYELIDVFVVSRPDKRVTRLVTPLKPFEAMQAGRPLVMSDLPALAEIVDDGKTGRLYPPEDVDSLTNIIHELLEDESMRAELGTAAANWVSAERTWSKVVEGTTQVYHELI
jgi:glycosyltransferase involved in cell wall biosynthesis